eukprot:935866-Rhodomonas_salina.1
MGSDRGEEGGGTRWAASDSRARRSVWYQRGLGHYRAWRRCGLVGLGHNRTRDRSLPGLGNMLNRGGQVERGGTSNHAT